MSKIKVYDVELFNLFKIFFKGKLCPTILYLELVYISNNNCSNKARKAATAEKKKKFEHAL